MLENVKDWIKNLNFYYRSNLYSKIKMSRQLLKYNGGETIFAEQMVTVAKTSDNFSFNDENIEQILSMYDTCTIGSVTCTPTYSHHRIIEQNDTSIIVKLFVNFIRKEPVIDISKLVKDKNGSFIIEIDLESK